MTKSITSEEADYAEYFEVFDGIQIPEGSTVVLISGKVRAAVSGESPIGVVRHPSGPAILCNNKNVEWSGKFVRNDFGTISYTDSDNGHRPDINPDYDDTLDYIPRKKRPAEWAPIGLLGQVAVLKNQPVSASWIKMWQVSDTVDMYYIFPDSNLADKVKTLEDKVEKQSVITYEEKKAHTEPPTDWQNIAMGLEQRIKALEKELKNQ